MERSRSEFLKLRLRRTGNAHAVQEVVDELLTVGADCPDDVLAAVTEKLWDGHEVSACSLARLVVETRNQALYRSFRTPREGRGPALRFDVSSAIKLLSAGIADPDIEAWLCSDLENHHSEDIVWRKQIVQALKECGSLACLPTLMAIEYEFDATYKSAATIQNVSLSEEEASLPVGMPKSFESHLQMLCRAVDVEYGRLLKEAVAAVKGRNLEATSGWGSGDAWGGDPFSSADKHLSALTLSNVPASLNCIRRALEAVLKQVIKVKELQIKSQTDVDEMTLDALIATVQGGLSLPKPVRVLLNEIQTSTTTGSHDQGAFDIDELIPPASVQGLLSKFDMVRGYMRDCVKAQV